MAKVIKSIRGIEVKQPTTLDIELYNLTKSGRVASGDMTMDIIAQKRKFQFYYAVLSGPEYEDIQTAIYSRNHPFFEIIYLDNRVEKRAIVYSGAIKRRRFRTDGIWYWKDVTFDLIEK